MRAAFVSMAGVSMASCMMGPNYTPPELELPAAYRHAAQETGAQSLADLQWFELFGDAQLTELVAYALEHNFDARIAAERVLQARAAYGITRGNLVPAVDGIAGINAVRTSRDGANGTIPEGADTDFGYLEAGFSVGWELDVWGRLRRLSQVARAQYLATEEARRGVITTLVADVTDSYLTLRTLDLELEIARRTRDATTDTLGLIQVRRTGGIASAVDLRQAEQLLFTARARIAGIEREIAQAENALNLLLGRFPGDVTRGRPLDAFQAPPRVPAGLPSTLLERRPDIRQA
jgi:multidrug efflux system outer membrane protein